MQKVNRIGEIVLVAFGIIASIFGIFSRFIYSAIFKNPEILAETTDEMMQEGFTMDDINQSFALLNSVSTYLTVIASISLIIGVIALFLLIGDRKAKVAGITLIVASVIILVASIGSGFFAFMFYLIAGIMAVVRKGKPLDVEDPFEEMNHSIDETN